MAFKPQGTGLDYTKLIGILNRSLTKSNDNSLYQVVKSLIEKGQQSNEFFSGQITTLTQTIQEDTGGGGSGNGDGGGEAGNITASYITLNNETSGLPNSIQLISGTGITFDTTVANQLTLSSKAYAPMTTGTEPIEIMSNGAGQVLMVGFSE